ncbi:MAG: DUF1573 domain-containing protein [Chitinispirillaceae bacterium]
MISRVASALLAAGFAISCLATPKIEVDNATYDCGSVKEAKKSESVKARFKLTNTGTSPLKIEKVRVSCGCTVVKFDSTIAPGKSSVIEPVVDIRGFRSGPMSKTVTIMSNAENSPSLMLKINARIVPVIDISETYIIFKPDSPKTLYVSTQKDDLNVKKVEFVPNAAKGADWKSNVPLKVDYEFVSLDSTRADDQFRVYRLDLQPLSSDGVVFGNFKISTNHKEKPDVVLRGRLGQP